MHGSFIGINLKSWSRTGSTQILQIRDTLFQHEQPDCPILFGPMLSALSAQISSPYLTWGELYFLIKPIRCFFFFLECEFQEEQHWEIKAVNLYLWHPWRDEKNKRYVVGVLLPQQVKHGWKGKSKVYSRFWSHFTAETVSYVSTPAGI